MSPVSLALRAWLRYVVPLTLLSAIATSAIGVFALRLGYATDAAGARMQVGLGWACLGSAWIAQFVLVAAVAPAVRALAAGPPLSQRRARTEGARGRVRGRAPGRGAAAAVAIGGIALVIPGLALLALLALTGASDQLDAPLPAALSDAVAVARANLRPVIATVVAMIALDAAIGAIAQLTLVHALPKKPPPASLHACRTFVRAIAIALIALSPLPACALAAVYARRART
jgi:hypothetical protein